LNAILGKPLQVYCSVDIKNFCAHMLIGRLNNLHRKIIEASIAFLET
jgi:hypothetical protein